MIQCPRDKGPIVRTSWVARVRHYGTKKQTNKREKGTKLQQRKPNVVKYGAKKCFRIVRIDF